MCLAQGPQRSDAGEARTPDPSVSSQAFYHRATALPCVIGGFASFHGLHRSVKLFLLTQSDRTLFHLNKWHCYIPNKSLL